MTISYSTSILSGIFIFLQFYYKSTITVVSFLCKSLLIKLILSKKTQIVVLFGSFLAVIGCFVRSNGKLCTSFSKVFEENIKKFISDCRKGIVHKEGTRFWGQGAVKWGFYVKNR